MAAEAAERGKTVVLVLDEAHLLSAEQLEELRMLTNQEMDSRATFAILLLGQPTLRRKLRQGTFAALDQRIALRCTIDGMDLKETGEYIAHHIKLAGRSDTLFSDDAAALIHEASRGLPPAGEQPGHADADGCLRDQQVDLRRELGARRGGRSLSRMTGELISRSGQNTPPSDPATGQPASITLTAPAGWPEPPGPDAFHGLPGAIVEKIAPHTEADPIAVLTQLLVCCGALIGRGAHFQVEATVHHPHEFVILMGDSAKARKGSSFDHVTRLLAEADPAFPSRLTTGLSSGEGLIWAVRDALRTGSRRRRQAAAGRRTRICLGVEGHRPRDLDLVAAITLGLGRSATGALDPHRPGPRHRCAHLDHRSHHRQRAAPSHHPRRARERLHQQVRTRGRQRVRLLPEGGDANPLNGSGLIRYLASVLKHAHTAGRVTLDPAARQLWWDTYPQLTQPGDGLAGQVLARAEAHTIRLALIHALLDGQRHIQPPHLQAALALWNYAARSTTWALGHATGDPLAEQIHAALVRSPDGLTRTQISHLLHRNLPADQLARALHALAATGRAHPQKIHAAGRPTELWTARPPHAI